MTLEPGTYIAAMAVGFLGGVHCAGMCGGIAGALSFGIQRDPSRPKTGGIWPFLCAYNVGRILTYTLLGALFGGIGLLAANLSQVHDLQRWLQVVAGLFMIALGFYIAGWWQGLTRLERGGSLVWQRVEPLGRKIMPVQTPLQALTLGLLWGFLPCGLVYSVLIWSLSTTDVVKAALLMLCFGLGTLPNLLLMGAFAAHLQRFIRHAWVRIGAGLLVIAFGIYMLYQVFFF